MSTRVLVVGPIARDVTLRVDAVPGSGASATADDAVVVAAGGKGANPASAAAALGVSATLIGAVGDDLAGEAVLAELAGRGIDVSAVQRVVGAPTAHIVHLVEPGGDRRYVEHPGANAELELTAVEVARRCATDTTILLSTAVPAAAARATAAAAAARRCRARLVIDASGEPESVRAVLHAATVLRCDSDEAQALSGRRPATGSRARAAGGDVQLAAGDRLRE